MPRSRTPTSDSPAPGINFIGNVEGRDIPRGHCDRGPIDVVVCDGFTGNVLLKFYESIAPMLIGMVAKVAGIDARQCPGVAQGARRRRARRRAAARRARRLDHLPRQEFAAGAS